MTQELGATGPGFFTFTGLAMVNSESDAENPVVGFVGLGRMGRPMAQRLLAQYPGLLVYDPDAAALSHLASAGAHPVSSVAEMASLASVVFASLPTPEVVRKVALGPGGLADGGARIFVDLSTTGSEAESEIAAALFERGIHTIDCPVSGGLSGGISGASSGTMALIVAGNRAIVDEIKPMLSLLGRIHYVGEQPGMAQTVKLINNLSSFAAIAITSEVMSIGAKAGIDAELILDIMNAGSGRNSATLDKFPKSVLTRSFDYGFPVNLSIKDIKLALREAERFGVPTLMGQSVLELFRITQCRFGPDVDMTSVVRTLEEWSGAEVKGKSESHPERQ